MCGADADMKRSAKAGLDALFLLLLHFFFSFFLKKHPCKYFSVLQKKEEKKKKKVCTVLLGGQVLLHFLKKESDWCPETWNVFVVVLRSKCIIVCYLLKISPIFLKIIICHYSL